MCYIFTLTNKFKANKSGKIHDPFQKVSKNSHQPRFKYSKGQPFQSPSQPQHHWIQAKRNEDIPSCHMALHVFPRSRPTIPRRIWAN